MKSDIKDKEINRIKELLLTEDLIDNKIGVGLALKQGMSYEDMGNLIIDEEIQKFVNRRMEELSILHDGNVDFAVSDEFRTEYLKYLSSIIKQIHETVI